MFQMIIWFVGTTTNQVGIIPVRGVSRTRKLSAYVAQTLSIWKLCFASKLLHADLRANLALQTNSYRHYGAQSNRLRRTLATQRCMCKWRSLNSGAKILMHGPIISYTFIIYFLRCFIISSQVHNFITSERYKVPQTTTSLNKWRYRTSFPTRIPTESTRITSIELGRTTFEKQAPSLNSENYLRDIIHSHLWYADIPKI